MSNCSTRRRRISLVTDGVVTLARWGKLKCSVSLDAQYPPVRRPLPIMRLKSGLQARILKTALLVKSASSQP